MVLFYRALTALSVLGLAAAQAKPPTSTSHPLPHPLPPPAVPPPPPKQVSTPSRPRAGTTSTASTAGAAGNGTRTPTAESYPKRPSSLETAPSGCLVVSVTPPPGGFAQLTQAVAALKAGSNRGSAGAGGARCIWIAPGTYNERVLIDVDDIAIYGASPSPGNFVNNKVTFQHSAALKHDGIMTDSASATVQIKANGVSVWNIIIKNNFPEGRDHQAVALGASGNRLAFYGLTLVSFQDTLYAKSGSQYYKNCYISGSVDFIFGAAAAWFQDCSLAPRGRGWVTANGRKADDATMFVFDNAIIEAAKGATFDGPVFLGRPWKHNAKVLFQNSDIGPVIDPKGWENRDPSWKPIFIEIGNRGAAAATNARQFLTRAAPAQEAKLFGDTSWFEGKAGPGGTTTTTTASTAKRRLERHP